MELGSHKGKNLIFALSQKEEMDSLLGKLQVMLTELPQNGYPLLSEMEAVLSSTPVSPQIPQLEKLNKTSLMVFAILYDDLNEIPPEGLEVIVRTLVMLKSALFNDCASILKSPDKMPLLESTLHLSQAIRNLANKTRQLLSLHVVFHLLLINLEIKRSKF